LVLLATWAQATERAAPVTEITQALVQGLGPPQAVTLPHKLAAKDFDRQGGLVTYRLTVNLPAAPERMVVRARALVGFEAERTIASGGLFSRWLFGRSRHALQQGVMAVAAVVIAAGGFMMGGGLSESLARQGEGHSATETVSTTSTASNEVSEFFAGDGI
jgi:hypothetical protein